MKTMKHVLALLLSVSLFLPLTQAQAASYKRQEPQATNRITREVLIVIQQEQVRFTAQSAVEEMRLEIFDQAGSLVYDSGTVTGPELTWVLQEADGEAVKSGLYAYALSVKEAGAADARTRRGHFIVDRARERDGKTDRLWITSRNESGIGTELTVAKNEDVTIAGTSAPTDQKSVRAARDGNGELENEKLEALTATANGTTGRIAKFISATDLGDSVITELNGRIGLGTNSPGTPLAVQTPTSSYGISHTDGNAVLATFVGTGNSTTTNGGWLGTVSNHDLRFFTANGPTRMMIGATGNVGIGTINPGTRLAVLTPTSTYGISHTDGNAVIATFVGTGNSTTTSGGWLGTVSNHDLRFFTANGPTRMTINTAGNVGVGVTDPQAKLDVAGQTRTQSLQITGGADFAENFDVSDAPASGEEMTKIEAGFVVSIDSTNLGKLQLSRKAYDRRVAGVISGAGGVKPGMVMSQEGTMADGRHPVALSGRVYCWVDASGGAIEPGDQLTTSNTPGHAMKASDAAKAQGAIIGKAMTGLKEGKGLVLVLVTLQ